MANCALVAMKHVQHRALKSLGCFCVVIPVIGVGGRGQKPQSTPATLFGEGEQARECSLRDDNEIDLLPDVLRRAVELVKQRRARGTRTLGQIEECRLAAGRPRGAVARIARKHEAVDHQAVLSLREQLRQSHICRGATVSSALEYVILRNGSARRERSPRGCQLLHRTTELNL